MSDDAKKIEDAKVKLAAEAKKWERVTNLREMNANHKNLPKNLEFSIKKTDRFTRRIREMKEKSSAELCASVGKLSLGKYVSEIVDAFLVAKLSKASDVAVLVDVASKMHPVLRGVQWDACAKATGCVQREACPPSAQTHQQRAGVPEPINRGSSKRNLPQKSGRICEYSLSC